MNDIMNPKQQRKNRTTALWLAIVAVGFFVAFVGAQILRSEAGV